MSKRPAMQRSSRARPRINARGQVWCYCCAAYLPPSAFKPPVQYPSWKRARYWAYCRECTQRKDRERWFRKFSDPEAWARERTRHNARKRARRKHEFTQRRNEIASGILLLRKRGLTMMDIATATGISFTSIHHLSRSQRTHPTRATAERIGALVALTVDWPQGEPVYRRRRPHPRRGELTRAMAWTRKQWPVRNRWRTFDEQQEEAA